MPPNEESVYLTEFKGLYVYPVFLADGKYVPCYPSFFKNHSPGIISTTEEDQAAVGEMLIHKTLATMAEQIQILANRFKI